MSADPVVEPNPAPAVPPATPPAQPTPPSAAEPNPAPPEPQPDPTPPAEPAQQGPWGDDWREKAAGEDEKAQNVLSRYKSPNDFVKSHMALLQKMSSGELAQTLPENPTDDELASYRKANGIPDEFGGYLDALPDGLVIGEDDKPIVEDFLKNMHGKNAPPAVVHEGLRWYYHEIEERKAALAEEDARFLQTSEDEMRAEWGGEYRPNTNIINNFKETLPGELKAALADARTSDGAPLSAHPDYQRWMLEMATTVNPSGTVVPAGGDSIAGDLQSRRADLEKMMRTDPGTYKRYHREEYADILKQQERLGTLQKPAS